MPTISVKKPFTVLVGIILVLVLGVVAFTKMTTDLLPNMDLPYMVVYATDPGASPESVEGEVTKPLESALGSTTGLKNITSTSNENVGIVVLEFEQGTDMNAVSIEMSNTIDQIKGSLPENSGTPVMMQITPDMSVCIWLPPLTIGRSSHLKLPLTMCKRPRPWALTSCWPGIWRILSP